MTVVAVNLIPREYRERRVVLMRVRRWLVGSVVLSSVVGVAWAVMASRVVENRQWLAGQLVSARADAEEKARLVSEAQSSHSAALRRLASARAVAGHPDWSVLLALLARARGEGLVLERVEVRPVVKAEPKNEPDDNGQGTGTSVASRSEPTYQLDIRGVAESQSLVAQYLLSLERIGLFESVRLRETKPRTIGARGVVEFGVDCAIAAGVKSAAQGSSRSSSVNSEGGPGR